MTLRRLHLLADADGTLIDWGDFFTERANTDFPHFPNIPRHNEQRSFNLKLGLNIEEAEAVDTIFNYPGFYRNLKPLPGAVEAIAKMEEKGHHVQIATSPWWANPTCLQDKADNLSETFGEHHRSRLILTSDKTAIRGDYLFDDKPEITGEYTKKDQSPTWTQIVYDQPYNREVLHLPRIYSWVEDDWEEILERLEEERWKNLAEDLLYG